MLLALKTEEGARSQGMQAISRRWGQSLSSRVSRRKAGFQTLEFSPVKPTYFRLLETGRGQGMTFQRMT